MKRGAWFLLGAVVTACAGVSACGGGGSTAGGAGTGGATTASGTGGAAPSCDAGATTCDGACADLSSDPHNCGRCGHDCLHGACAASVCQAWSILVGTTVSAMDADGKYVVWADLTSKVHQIPAEGGTAVTVSQPTGAIPGGGPVLDNGTVAFCGSDRVYGVPEDQVSTTTSALFTGYAPGPLALAPDGSTAYLLGAAGAPYSYSLLSCPLTASGSCAPLGGTVDPAVQGEGLAMKLRVSAAHAFWFYESSPAALTRFTFGSEAVDSVSVNAGTSFAVALDASNVYWIGSPFSSIYALPQSFTGGATPTKVATVPQVISGLASDGTNVYFGQLDGSMSYVPVGGGAVQSLYHSANTGMPREEGFVVAAGGAIYWADVRLDTSPAVADLMGIAVP